MNGERQTVKLIGECSSVYRVDDLGEEGIRIHIEVPRRFADLWIVKLNELRVTDEEIATYSSDHLGND